jgi:transcriptional regulator with XRE-family HTH domain
MTTPATPPKRARHTPPPGRDERFAALNRWFSLYGHPDGRWLLVQGAIGHISVSHIGDLVHMGETEDLIIGLAERLKQREIERRRQAAEAEAKVSRNFRVGVQQEIAEILGVGQQAVSRYLRQETEPKLSNDGYTRLVTAWFEVVYPTLDLPDEEWKRATGREPLGAAVARLHRHSSA